MIIHDQKLKSSKAFGQKTGFPRNSGQMNFKDFFWDELLKVMFNFFTSSAKEIDKTSAILSKLQDWFFLSWIKTNKECLRVSKSNTFGKFSLKIILFMFLFYWIGLHLFKKEAIGTSIAFNTNKLYRLIILKFGKEINYE